MWRGVGQGDGGRFAFSLEEMFHMVMTEFSARVARCNERGPPEVTESSTTQRISMIALEFVESPIVMRGCAVATSQIMTGRKGVKKCRCSMKNNHLRGNIQVLWSGRNAPDPCSSPLARRELFRASPWSGRADRDAGRRDSLVKEV